MGNRISRLMDKFKSQSLPIIVILGSTGTGKSKLAIQLAKKFNGEIISADSMQVYKGLDIITNKVTSEEQKEATHHFINCTDSLTRYTVVDFRNRALPLIHELFSKKKIPIIVGGTNYYIESLLFDILIKPEKFIGDTLLYDEDKTHESNSESCSYTSHELLQSIDIHPHHSNSEDNDLSEDYSNENNVVEEKTFPTVQEFFKCRILHDSMKDVSNEVLHSMLQKVDPAMADSLHPNDRRKVLRSLQVYQQHQYCHSNLLAEQRSKEGGSSLGGPPRFHNIMLWLQCDKHVLDDRLDKRVDQMIKSGLIAELLNFHKVYNAYRLKQKLKPTYEEGIFQSIGFKEFHDYLLLSDEERLSPEGEKMLEEAVEDVKLVTRKYARKQVKWITNRFLKKPDRKAGPVYALNVTDLEQWDSSVLTTASHIIECTLRGLEPEINPLPIESQSCSNLSQTHFCEICNKRIVGNSKAWEIHINSRKHYRQKVSLKKKEKMEAEKNKVLNI